MAQTVKMIDIVVAGRMARMKVAVSQPAEGGALKRTGEVIADAMRKAAEAESNNQPRSKYRKNFNF